MASLFQKILKAFSGKKETQIILDPESVKSKHINQALLQENAKLKGEKAKLESKIGILRQKDEDKHEDENSRIELNEQKKEIKKQQYPEYFSFRYFFDQLQNNKTFRNKIAFYDWNRGTRLAKFGDFGISTDGDFVILDSRKRVLMKAGDLGTIFQSYAGLVNDVPTGKIPINVTKDGEFVENPMVFEAPEFTPTDKGKYQWAIAKKKPFYEYLTELREQITEQHEDIERLELTNTHQKKELDEMKVAQRISQNDAETSRANLSIVEKETNVIVKAFRNVSSQYSKVLDTNQINEEKMEKLENEFQKMKDEAEGENTRKSLDKAIELVQRVRREIIENMPPEKIAEVPPKSPSPK